jgi:hypothetical protein
LVFLRVLSVHAQQGGANQTHALDEARLREAIDIARVGRK